MLEHTSSKMDEIKEIGLSSSKWSRCQPRKLEDVGLSRTASNIFRVSWSIWGIIKKITSFSRLNENRRERVQRISAGTKKHDNDMLIEESDIQFR